MTTVPIAYRGRHRSGGSAAVRRSDPLASAGAPPSAGAGPWTMLGSLAAVSLVAGGLVTGTVLSGSASSQLSTTAMVVPQLGGAAGDIVDLAGAPAGPATGSAADPAAGPANGPAARSGLGVALAAPRGEAAAIPGASEGILGFTAAKAASGTPTISVRPVTGVAGVPVSRAGSRTGAPSVSGYGGLSANAQAVVAAVRATFPQITSIGGLRGGGGDHGSGHAVDIMTSDVALGTAIAEYMRANAGRLGITYVIWRQRVWMPIRASEGWRLMEDRGSPTANHYDHVHVSVA